MEICIGLCMMAMFSPIVLSTLQLPRCQCPPFVTASGVKTARAAFPPRKSVMTSRTVTTDPMNISAVSHSTAPIVVVTTNLSLALLHFVCSSTIKPTPPEKKFATSPENWDATIFLSEFRPWNITCETKLLLMTLCTEHQAWLACFAVSR